MKLQRTYILKSFIYAGLSLLAYHSSAAYAGADNYCQPNLALDDRRYNDCSNLAVLYPSNDNQTNMVLLLSDLGLGSIAPMHADKTLWDANYGTVPFDAANFASFSSNKIPNQRKTIADDDTFYDERCNSFHSGNLSFITQVQQHKNIPSAEKQILIAERKKLSNCGDKMQLLAVDPNWSATTRQYASYINAAVLFYNSNFSAATKIYTVLSSVDDAWLKETAQYMLIRTSLNSTYATGVDQYGDVNLDNINQNLLKQFLDNITIYLKAYPNGQYVASARGLMRRGFWLTKRQDLLVNEMVWQIQNPQSKFYNLDVSKLPAEIDRRVFGSSSFNPKNLKDPFFLAVYDLMYMRASTSSNDYRPMSWQHLTAQKDAFKTQPELFQYSQAAHLYFVLNKAQQALDYLPNANAAPNNYLQLSQAFLRGQILEKTASKAAAEQYWKQMLAQSKNSYHTGLFETALSKHLAARQDYAAYIGNKAKISQLNLQRHFITQVANSDSLEKIALSTSSNLDQKLAASYTLLNKSLVHQNFALFNKSYALLPKNAAQYRWYNSDIEALKNQPDLASFTWNGSTISPQLKCANLKTLVTQLEKAPKDPLLNICLGEFVRSGQGYALQLLSDNEQQAPTFTGKVFTRGQVYKDIINSSHKGELHAYALYRAIQCYAPSGYNECNDAEVSKSTRKQWFDQIKRDYPNSTWAKSLKYYW